MKAAIDLFANDGLSVTTAEIAKKAKVSKGTLFNYFDTKQDLTDGTFLYIEEKMAHDVMTEIEPTSDFKAFSHEVWNAFTLWAQQHPAEHLVLALLKTSQTLSKDIKRSGDAFWEEVFERINKAIQENVIVDLPLYYHGENAAAQMNVVIAYIRDNNLSAKEKEKIIQASFESYWNGIKAG